jgi:hypothetical protein
MVASSNTKFSRVLLSLTRCLPRLLRLCHGIGATGMTQSTLYRHLRELAQAGSRGAGQPGAVAGQDHRGAVTVSDRLPVVSSHGLARVCT